MSEKLKSERGAVPIVEAAFVFPIVFFVVILLIYFGNLLYQQSKMDAIAVKGAQYMAAVYTNPLLLKDTIPTNTTEVNLDPYRYIVGGEQAEKAAEDYMKQLMASTGTGLFSGMEMNGTVKTCEIKNYIIYQTANVQIEYSIELLPMKLFGAPSIFRCSVANVTAASDSAEFIRNVDMIMDYAEKGNWGEKLDKVKSFMK